MRIILVGFMGVGKTTIGRLLSSRLNLEFIDMDLEIEKNEKLSINEIFNKYGENYFRNLETKLLYSLVKKDNVVISTGGGVVTSDKNIKLLKKEKNVIFLDANKETIIKNITYDLNKRPLLNEDLEDKVDILLKDRYKKYIKASNYKINVDFKSLDEILEILESEIL